MSRYIDAEALIDRLDYCVKEGMGSTIAFTFKHIADEAPSIDIVRCKECKFNGVWCDIQDIQWSGYDKPVEWCSYGEREGE